MFESVKRFGFAGNFVGAVSRFRHYSLPNVTVGDFWNVITVSGSHYSMQITSPLEQAATKGARLPTRPHALRPTFPLMYLPRRRRRRQYQPIANTNYPPETFQLVLYPASAAHHRSITKEIIFLYSSLRR